MQTKRKLLNTQEAAEYLGLAFSYFRKMMMRRVIPMYITNIYILRIIY